MFPTKIAHTKQNPQLDSSNMTEYHFNAEDLIVFCPMKLNANILYTMLADPVFVFLSVEEKRRLYLTSGKWGGGVL